MLNNASLSSRTKSCCLCLSDLTRCKGKTRQKKLFGENCTLQRQRLEECVREDFCTDAKKFDKDSIICYECLLKLGNLMKYEKEIQRLKKDIFDLLSKLGID